MRVERSNPNTLAPRSAIYPATCRDRIRHRAVNLPWPSFKGGIEDGPVDRKFVELVAEGEDVVLGNGVIGSAYCR